MTEEFKGLKSKNNSEGREKLSNKIWEKIEESQMKPVAKWRWQVKELMNWSIFFSSVLLGSISFSVILLELFSADWDLYTYLTDSFSEYLFGILPYFWIMFLLIMLGIAYYRFFHTKSAYRYSGLRILIYSLGLSLVLGFLLYFLNMSAWVYDLTHEYIPRPDAYKINTVEMWSQPEEGLLAGKLVELLSKYEVKLIDFNDKAWVINFSTAKIYDMRSIRIGEAVKLIGEKIDENSFRADEARPWKKNILFKIKPIKPGLPNLLPAR